MSEKKTLAQRMHAVMQDVTYIQKGAKAGGGLPYRFVSHDQVTGRLHEAFVNHGILSLTDVVELKQDGNRTTVKAKVTFINVDDKDDKYEVHGYGYGIDSQDKGVGKAVSYATKYAYLKCFMLETGDDPERDNEDYKPDNKLLEELFEQLPQEHQQNLLRQLKITSIVQLPKERFNAVIKAIKRKLEENHE